jgi:protein-S-isoprenylcysteine O-methyltransferase Ste14
MRFSKEDTAINYVGKVYRIISAFVFITIILNAFAPSIMKYLVPINYFELIYLKWAGLGLMHLALILIFVAQQNLANSWRIGIDSSNKVNLVTHGLFAISRNPIFLCVILTFLGLFLIIPNVLTAIILVSGIIVIQVQVRLEEAFLLNELGEEYKKYLSTVKRWLF